MLLIDEFSQYNDLEFGESRGQLGRMQQRGVVTIAQPIATIPGLC